MGEAFLLGKKGGGGGKINDSIEVEKYVYKGETIKEGDLVVFKEGASSYEIWGVSTEGYLANGDQFGNHTNAIVLKNGNVLAAGLDVSANCLQLRMYERDGTTLSLVSSVNIPINYSRYYHNMIEVSNGLIFVTFPSKSSYYLYGATVQYTDTELTLVEYKQLSTASNSCYKIPAIVPLSETRIFVAYDGSSMHYLYGQVVSIDSVNYTITSGNEVSISTSSYTGYNFRAKVMEDGRILITHSYSGSCHLYASIVSVSDRTVTVNAKNLVISAQNYNGFYMSDIVHLKDNTYMIFHSSDSNYHLANSVFTINGTTSTTSITNAGIATVANTGYILRNLIELSDNTFLICYYVSTGIYFYFMRVNSDGVVITKKSVQATTLTPNTWSYCRLIPMIEDGSIVLFLNTDNSANLIYCMYCADKTNLAISTEISNYTTEEQASLALEYPFDGVAKTSGEGGTDTEHKDKIKVLVPKGGNE